MGSWRRSFGWVLLVLGCSSRVPLPPPSGYPGGLHRAVGIQEDGLSNELFSDLLELPSDRVPVHYLPGSLDRATRVQWRLDPSLLRFARLTRRPQKVRVLLLDRERWERLGLREPYGLPVRVGPGSLAVAAIADRVLVETVERLLGGPVPEHEGEPLIGNAKEAGALAVADVLLTLEACYDFVLRVGPQTEDAVTAALLAHWLARLAFEEEGKAQVMEVARWLDQMALANAGGKVFPARFYPIDRPWRERLRWEARFFRAADLLWVKEGTRGSERAFYRWLERGKTVRLEALQERYPVIRGIL